MTEEEWLASDNLYVLLRCPALRATDRMLRLFAVACCRRLGRVLVTPRYRRLIDAAEKFADDLITPEQFQADFPRTRFRRSERRTDRYAAREAIQAMKWVRNEATLRHWDDWFCEAVESDWGPGRFAEHYTMETAGRVAHAVAYHSIGSPVLPATAELNSRYGDAGCLEWAGVVGTFRDIFGNPFRPIAFDPCWRTEAVVALARWMYESRDFSPIPVMADALEDAGCADESILTHCRGEGPHVKGCWVVDECLGKS